MASVKDGAAHVSVGYGQELVFRETDKTQNNSRGRSRPGLPVQRAAEAGRLVPAELDASTARRSGAACSSTRSRCPIVLAYQLGRTDAATWSHVKRAADFLLGFRRTATRAPWSPQERWENQSGYSPGHHRQRDRRPGLRGVHRPRQRRHRLGRSATWPPPTTGRRRSRAGRSPPTGRTPAGPYFLRLTKDGNPNAGTTYTIGDSGPSNVDQRTRRRPELPRPRPARRAAGRRPGRASTRSRVVDEQLGVRHRARLVLAPRVLRRLRREGRRQPVGLRPAGRLAASPAAAAWPLLNGERGEYQIAAGRRRARPARS